MAVGCVRVHRRLLLALVVVLAASGCGGPFDGQVYESVDVNGRELVADTSITLSFDGHMVAMDAGCNTTTVGHRVRRGRLETFGDTATTLVGCTPELSRQDAWLARWLGDGVEMRTRADAMTLEGEGVVVELRRI